jgi:hypothetical protein
LSLETQREYLVILSRLKKWDAPQLFCGLLKPEEAGYLVEFLMDREVDRADYLDGLILYMGDERATKGAFQHLLLNSIAEYYRTEPET